MTFLDDISVSIQHISYEGTMDELERTVHEIQALSMIYNDDDIIDEHTNSATFTIISKDDYAKAETLVEDEGLLLEEDDPIGIPTLCVEANLTIGINGIACPFKIHISLPPGYPNLSANISIVAIGKLSRSQRDELSKVLNEKAVELSGGEALMTIIQDAQDTATDFLSQQKETENEHNENEYQEAPVLLSRRWIWVHHITNSGRCKDIVREAQERSLSGYLKSGYPGIVVVEGDSRACDEFVQWIKGNKSRPGGFGRNWGHHVRGEVMLHGNVKVAFTNTFEHMDDLSKLAAVSRDKGVEDEFKEYVLKHA